jgi:hypothetical protein
VVVEPILTVRDTLGTPAEFNPKTIQFPGGTTPGSAGMVTEYVEPEVGVQGRPGPHSSMRRWSVSTACVEEPYRMMAILERATLPVTVNALPFAMVVTDTVMVGRDAALPSALKR